MWQNGCSDRRYVYTWLFADDQVVLAEEEEDANYIVRKLVEEFINED